jgi:hypothetical protein
MAQKSRLILVVVASFLVLPIILAQTTVPATGGNATGIGGSVSYTVGQLGYITITGTTGTLAQGVQQPFEISVVTEIDESMDLNLICSVYPNPTADYLTLKVVDYDILDLTYRLYGVGGNLIEAKKVLGTETKISMGNQASGIYFIKITSGKKGIKTFKIIKK